MGLDSELLHRMLYYMKLQRELEDRIERKLYRQGLIVGGVYVGRGQEAIGVGTSVLAGPDDALSPTHRDLGVFLVRGMSPRTILAQYMGRGTGPTRGRDGNMHMPALELGVVGFISSMAAVMPVAVGVALAKRYKGQPGAVFSYFGDGATSRGDWHEAINFAAVQKLPMIYVCNNNQYAYSTPLELQMPVQNVADRGVAYAMPAEIVDGNDIIAVYQAGQRALQHAQAGKGPAMIECKTFRMTGHSAHDPAEYVPKSMFEHWAKKDPITRLEAVMMEWGFLSEAARDELDRRVMSEVDDAVSWAEQQPMPDPASLTEGVYDEGGGELQPQTEATRTISDAVTTAKA